jgi:hypothetical protein
MMVGPMTSQASTIMRFERALQKRNIWLAEDAARHLKRPLTLEEALRLLLLYRNQPAKYERAAARWIARYAAESPQATLADVELAAGLLRGVLQEHDWEAVAALEAFATANGWRLAA